MSNDDDNSSKGTESNNGWTCAICHTSKYYPMMIILCGHTFCEDCLQELTRKQAANCPVCRVPFTPYDCQPNYALTSGKDRQPINRGDDLDTRLSDLVTMKMTQIRGLVKRLTSLLVDQLYEQTISAPDKIAYTCKIPSDTGSDILQIVKDKLYRYGIDIGKHRSEPNDADSIYLDIHFYINKKIYTFGQSENTYPTVSVPYSNGMGMGVGTGAGAGASVGVSNPAAWSSLVLDSTSNLSSLLGLLNNHI